MDGSVVVSQLGARMHYAVPRIFASRERLAHFYTDICALQGWPRFSMASRQPCCPLRCAGLWGEFRRVFRKSG